MKLLYKQSSNPISISQQQISKCECCTINQVEHNSAGCQKDFSSASKPLQLKNNNIKKRRKNQTDNLNASKLKRENDQILDEIMEDDLYINEFESSTNHLNDDYKCNPKIYKIENAKKLYFSPTSKNQRSNLFDSTCSSIHSSSPSSSSLNNLNNSGSPFFTDGLYLLASAACSELEKVKEIK